MDGLDQAKTKLEQLEIAWEGVGNSNQTEQQEQPQQINYVCANIKERKRLMGGFSPARYIVLVFSRQPVHKIVSYEDCDS